MNFSNFFFWEVYPNMVIHGKYIFITYGSAGRERNLGGTHKYVRLASF